MFMARNIQFNENALPQMVPLAISVGWPSPPATTTLLSLKYITLSNSQAKQPYTEQYHGK